MLANIKQNNRGFTLVELNLSLLILSVITISLLAIFTNFLVLITRNGVRMDMTTDSQSLLRSVVEELRYGAGVRQTNTITDANGPPGGWNTSNNDVVVIVAVPALDSSNNYIINSDTGEPYLNELVYFKQGPILYKRILANPSAAGNRLKTSCPSTAVSSTCLEDRKLTDNVDTMVFTLYDQDDASTTNALAARSIKIDLSLQKDTFGEPIVIDNSIRVTLRNTF